MGNLTRRLITRKSLLVLSLASTGLMAAAALGAYWFAPALLTIDSGECRADVIVVLGGDPYGRPIRAAELFHAGATPLIIVSGDGDCQEVVSALQARGVPEAAILTECESGSTKENAEFTVRMMRENGGKAESRNQAEKRLDIPSAEQQTNSQPSTLNSQLSAIIVTSWYHSRRALACFEKAAPEIRFYSRPSYYGSQRSDWRRTATSSHIRAELIKIPAYALLYGIWPW